MACLSEGHGSDQSAKDGLVELVPFLCRRPASIAGEAFASRANGGGQGTDGEKAGREKSRNLHGDGFSGDV